MRLRTSVLSVLLALTFAPPAGAQQVTASDYTPVVRDPAFALGAGPIVLVDESHNNFHTVSPTRIPDSTHEGYITIPGRLGAFRDLLTADGYRVRPVTEGFSAQVLSHGSILVISNALADANVDDWGLPNPSAFEPEEITAVVDWVRDGGALLLIADHQPWPAAAGDLALSLGLILNNGSASIGDPSADRQSFTRADDSLRDHPIVRGRSEAEAIRSVMTFGGQAFRPAPGAEVEPLLVFPLGSVLVMLQDPFGPEPDLERVPNIRVDGMLQGAVLRVGQGRVAVFGEAAMFTAQVTGPERRPMGLNHPGAAENAQFVLNVMHWLSGLLPDASQ